uniref:GBD/FH3 domain-containing protein n=1 Tax=Acrobeloides nanus TaxID=290746 RepID=A0A914C7A6_9BILA
MIEDFMERAWSCLNKLKAEKKPPDRPRENSITTVTFSSGLTDSISKRSNYLTLDPAALPEADELNEAFQKLLEELDLSPEKRQVMAGQSDEKKWLMVIEQNIRKEKAQQSATCDNFLQVLEEYARTFPEKYSLPLASQNLEALSISLRTESFSYVQRFIEQNGVDYLTTILHRSRNGGGGELVAIPILSCFKALLNSTAGRACVLDSSDALLAITGALDLHNPRCKTLSLEILSGLCVVPEGGHQAVLKALTEAMAILGERTRFQKIVDDLHREHGSPRDTE